MKCNACGYEDSRCECIACGHILDSASMQHEDLNRICNRHKRRLLDKLEGGSCPDIYRDAVKIELDWLRDDLRDALDGKVWDGKADTGNREGGGG